MQLVELMNGRIEVESQLGQGSIFNIYLPLPAGERKVTLQHETSQLLIPPLNILVADDVPQNLNLARLMLEQRGHQVTTACDGDDAVDKYRSGYFDLVLMDVHMPGTDGLQATRRIRQYERRLGRQPTPVLALTASVMSEDKRAAYNAGMNGFAVKPLDEPKLMAEIATALNITPPADSSGIDTGENAGKYLIDWQMAASLWGNKARYAEALDGFLSDVADRYPLPKEHRDDADWQAALFNLHSIRGAAANLALPAVVKLAAELEQRIRSGERREAVPAITWLYRLFELVAEELSCSGELTVAATESETLIDEAELLVKMHELLASLKRHEINPDTLELVCAGLGASGRALKAAVNEFEFGHACVLLELCIKERT